MVSNAIFQLPNSLQLNQKYDSFIDDDYRDLISSKSKIFQFYGTVVHFYQKQAFRQTVMVLKCMEGLKKYNNLFKLNILQKLHIIYEPIKNYRVT